MASLSTFTMMAVPPTPTTTARSRSTAVAVASAVSANKAQAKDPVVNISFDLVGNKAETGAGGEASFWPPYVSFGKMGELANLTDGDASFSPPYVSLGKKGELVNSTGGDASFWLSGRIMEMNKLKA